jgi:hypothetical protein
VTHSCLCCIWCKITAPCRTWGSISLWLLYPKYKEDAQHRHMRREWWTIPSAISRRVFDPEPLHCIRWTLTRFAFGDATDASGQGEEGGMDEQTKIMCFRARCFDGGGGSIGDTMGWYGEGPSDINVPPNTNTVATNPQSRFSCNAHTGDRRRRKRDTTRE